MTFTLDAVAEPSNVPPRIALTATESDTELSLQSVLFYRDGVPLRFEAAVTGDEAIAYDYDAPFDVPLAYRADGGELGEQDDWTETWGSASTPPTGWTGSGWSAASSVATSTAGSAVIYRDTTTGSVIRMTVTTPTNLTVQLTDSSNNVVVAVTTSPDGTTTLLGSTASRVTGSGSYTLTLSETAATVAGTGWSTSVPISDLPTSRVRLVAPGLITYVTKYGTHGTSTGQLDAPRRIAFDSAGNFFVTDESRKRVLKYNSSGVYQSEFGTSGSGAGQFGAPHSIAIDGSDNMFVTDLTRHKVIKFNSAGVYQSEFGSSGTGNGQFNTPRGIAFDSSGNIFVCDAGNSRVQKFNSAGTYQSQFGSYGTGNGQFSTPHGIAIDASNNIFVTDYGNNRVQKFNSSGTYQSQFGTLGSGNGQFRTPHSIAIDSSGNIYVTDQGNYRVQKFTSAGAFVTAAGSKGSGDGQFDFLVGIAVRSSGDIYVVDAGINDRIQKATQAAGSVDDIAIRVSLADNPLQVSAEDTETLSPTGATAGAWLTNAAVPELAILAEAEPASSDDDYFIVTPATQQTRSMAANTASLPIEGSADVLTVVLGPRRNATWNLAIACTTQAAAEALEALLANTSAISLRFPTTSRWQGLKDGFYAVGDVDGERIGHPQLGPVIIYTLPLTPSRAPKFKPLWQWNWDTLAQTGMSWDDVNAAFASWNDLLVGPS